VTAFCHNQYFCQSDFIFFYYSKTQPIHRLLLPDYYPNKSQQQSPSNIHSAFQNGANTNIQMLDWNMRLYTHASPHTKLLPEDQNLYYHRNQICTKADLSLWDNIHQAI
jgi:hypothetical protein